MSTENAASPNAIGLSARRGPQGKGIGMGHVWPTVRTAVEIPKLAECRAMALDYARGVIWGFEASDRVRNTAFRIVDVTLELHGNDPHATFPLTRERMATPPKRSNRFAPRKRDSKDGGASDKPKPKRNKWNVVDRFAKDARVKWLRGRVGNETAGIVQKAQKLIEDTGLFEVNRLGQIEGKRRKHTNAWKFGTVLADQLSKAFLGQKSEYQTDQNRAQALSDFFVTGAKRHGVDLVPILVAKALEGVQEKRKAAADALRKMWETARATASRQEPLEGPSDDLGATVAPKAENDRPDPPEAIPGPSAPQPDPTILANLRAKWELEGLTEQPKLSAAALKPRGPGRFT